MEYFEYVLDDQTNSGLLNCVQNGNGHHSVASTDFLI